MSIRILVADDDPLMRVFANVSLTDVAETVEAADGTEALHLLREQHFGLVLLDWDMPGQNGVEILKALREQGCTTPVIMVTAKNERGNVLQAIHAGASDYLIKPFEPNILREKVEKWLAA
ncbi:MAG: response regulator [Thermoguttaceae bacterium]|jgi:two-component system chemotaxis response regulator CheY|nr:response regulator [Thermoguttaceae bacterium]